MLGRDDENNAPPSNFWQQGYKRASLSAIYEFLERFTGARYFFPGEHGTIVPFQGALYIPEKIRIIDRPDMHHRNFSGYFFKAVYYPGYMAKDGTRGEMLSRIRLRFSEYAAPYGHGICNFKYLKRFAKTNPEYFAMTPDGKRHIDPDMVMAGHLCYNSGIREVIYQDVKKIMIARNKTAPDKAFVSIMPEDWFYWCGCEKCRKLCEPGRHNVYYHPQQRKAANDFLWEHTVEVANRLTKEGIKGTVTQMAYTPYNLIPKCKIPANVEVQVAVYGLGGNTPGDVKNTKLIKDWYNKLGRKVTVWTYAQGKHGSKKIPGIPPMMPKHIGNFIDTNKKYIAGGYFESEHDYAIFQYLNYYILGKKLWNNSLNVDELLNDHHKVMFGAAAPLMKQFYEFLEDLWIKKIHGNIVDSGLGPKPSIPSDFQIFNTVLNPGVIKKYDDIFNKAERAAAKDKGAVSRIKFIREHLYGPMRTGALKYHESQKALDSWYMFCPGSVYLRACRGEVNEVNTKVSLRKDTRNLVVTFECEEPRMKDIFADVTKRDGKDNCKDSCVEFFINPSGDRKNYFHFIVNTNGAVSDYKNVRYGKSDINWNSSVKAKITKGTNAWTAELTIPLKDLGKLNPNGVPVNFGRHRSLKNPKVNEVYYEWSPNSGRKDIFHSIESWGIITFKEPAGTFLVKTDFTEKKLSGVWLSGGKKGGQICKVDDKVFITGGKSLYFKNVSGMSISCGWQFPNMKPNTKYRLSYFLKTRNIVPPKGKKGGAGSFIYFNKVNGRQLPQGYVTGTNNWHRVSCEFKTPADTGKGRTPILGLWNWFASGEAWFDCLRLEEIK